MTWRSSSRAARANIATPDRPRRGPVGPLGGQMVGPAGLEPATYGLKVRSSAIELEAHA